MQAPASESMGAPAPEQSRPAAEPPLMLGRYRVVETRGTGGFGSVYVCWDIVLERRVAIKCMPLATAPGTSASTLNEALAEARITSGLSHPNIVTVHDFEISGNAAYLIMEFVDGLTLAELMARVEGGVLTYDECAHLLSCLAGALSYAHERGVLHFDIKPSNVFIDKDGNVKLGDFGMAGLASAAGWEGARGGTIGYMPPEQLECGVVDERTDVFALAVVCYQALTGSCPFAATDATASLKRINKGALPLSKVENELAGPVNDGIMRALNPDAAARPSTAAAFAASVLPYLGDELEGRASVAQLMAQTTGETGPDEQQWERAAHVRAIERWPWLPRAFERLLAAVVTGLAAWPLVGVVAAAIGEVEALGLNALDPVPLLVGRLALPLVALLSPLAAGLIGCALALAAILATGIYTPAFLLALVTGLALALWWVAAGSHGTLSATALLAPAAASLGAGAGLSGLVLPPIPALTTAAMGVLLAHVLALVPAAESGEALVGSVLASLSQPSTWVLAAGCALGAWAASTLRRIRARGHGRGWAVAGQVAACAIVSIAQLAIVRVENGGIWDAGAIAVVGIAVFCCLLMSVAIVTLGPKAPPREGD